MYHPAGKTYAQAAFNCSDSWLDFLQRLAIIAKHSDFMSTANNPNVSNQTLLAIINKIYALNKDQTAFVSLLIDKKRILLADQILLHYTKLLDTAKNTSKVQVCTAKKTNKQQKATIEDYAKKQLKSKQKLEYNYIIDPDLIAGFTLHNESTLIDCSIKGQLSKLQETIAGDIYG